MPGERTSVTRIVLSLGLSDPFLQSGKMVAPKLPLLSVKSIQRCEATSNCRSVALGRWIVPTSQLYVASLFDALRGMATLRLAERVFQSMAFANSTRLPALPAARL